MPKPTSRICSLHFHSSDIMNNHLSPSAIPILKQNNEAEIDESTANDHTYALPSARAQIHQREFMHETIENLVGKVHGLNKGKRKLNAKIDTLKSKL